MGNLWLFLVRLVPIIGLRPLPSTPNPLHFLLSFSHSTFHTSVVPTALLSDQYSLSFIDQCLGLFRFRINFSHHESCRHLVKNNKLEKTYFIGIMF
jgi:hypothetical protein